MNVNIEKNIFKFNKADVAVVIIMILLSAVIVICSFLLNTDDTVEGGYVRVVVDGEVYGEYSLDEDITETVVTEWGYNILNIADRCVYISDSDCGNKDCVRYGLLKSSGGSIICLPHRLVVEIISQEGTENEVDVIAK